MSKKAIVIGAGFGGLAAAARLRARGYHTTLLERLDQLGGRAAVFRRNGFVFDAGPTVVTAPFLFDELFELFGKTRSDYVTFVPLDPYYRIVFADGSHFDYGGPMEKMLAEIRRFEPADADGYLRLLDKTKRIFDKGFIGLGDKPFSTVWSMAKVAPSMAALGAWRTVWQLACKYIKNENLRRVFSFQPLLVGGNPFNTTSIYSLIHYLERQWGVHFAMGGTGSIVSALGRLLTEQGVDIRLNAQVEQIIVKDGRATGVRLVGGQPLDADIVVCNADAPFVYKHLIAAEHRRKWTDRRVEKMDYSMGLFVMYFGTRRKYPDIQHHTIILGRRYGELLNDIFNQKKLAEGDLSLYLHRPTATDPSMAPPGCDCWYILAPVPNLQGNVDWKTTGPRYRDIVVGELERTIMPGLRDCICEEGCVTPQYFLSDLGTLHGTGFSIQPTFMQSAYFRFHNKSEDVAGLYFVGAATHPGAGMPGVLCSAKVLEHLL